MRDESRNKKTSEPKLDGSEYSCQVLLEKCTLDQQDKSFPTDARLLDIRMTKQHFTRSAKPSNIFVLIHGMGALQAPTMGMEHITGSKVNSKQIKKKVFPKWRKNIDYF